MQVHPTAVQRLNLSPPPPAKATLLSLRRDLFCKRTQNRRGPIRPPHQEPAVLHYAVVFFVIALIAALFGFGGIAASAVGIAKILFFVFAILAVASFLFGLTRKR